MVDNSSKLGFRSTSGESRIVFVQQGSSSSPSISFGSGSGTGFYGNGTGSIGVSSSGSTIMTLGSSTNTSLLPFKVPNGSVSAPGLTINESNNGIYSAGSHLVDMAANGTQVMEWTSAANSSKVPMSVPNGSASGVGLSLRNVNNGIYSTATGRVDVSAGGTPAFRCTGTGNTSWVELNVPVGVAAAPGLNIAESNNGLYSAGSHLVDMAANGTQVMEWSSAGTQAFINLSVPAGGEATPGLNFLGDSTTGFFYDPMEPDVGVSYGGTQVMSFASARNESKVPLKVQAGTNAAPSLNVGSSTDTGLYSSGGGKVDVSANGTQAMEWTSTNNTSYLPLNVPSGIVSIPGLWLRDSNNGIYSAGTGLVDVSAAGTRVLECSSTNVNSLVPLQAPQGSVSAPGLWLRASGNGLYSPAANTVNMAANGTATMTWTTDRVTSALPMGCTKVTTYTSGSGTFATSDYIIKLTTTGGTYTMPAFLFAGQKFIVYSVGVTNTINSDASMSFVGGGATATSISLASSECVQIIYTESTRALLFNTAVPALV